MDHIYIIRTINLKSKTESDLKKEYEIAKINYPNWRNNTYFDYVNFLKSWNNDKYEMTYEDNGYYDNSGIAMKKILSNTFDINDGGVYNYAMLIKTPLNHLYAMTEIKEDNIVLYKFDYNTDEYYLIEYEYDEEEETKFIINKTTGKS